MPCCCAIVQPYPAADSWTTAVCCYAHRRQHVDGLRPGAPPSGALSGTIAVRICVVCVLQHFAAFFARRIIDYYTEIGTVTWERLCGAVRGRRKGRAVPHGHGRKGRRHLRARVLPLGSERRRPSTSVCPSGGVGPCIPARQMACPGGRHKSRSKERACTLGSLCARWTPLSVRHGTAALV